MRTHVVRLIVTAALVGMPALSLAATNIVRIGSFFFNPTNITVNVGDTIVWSNTVFTTHDTTQQTNFWPSTSLLQNQTFSFKFTNVGFYRYICSLHIIAHPEQTGTVTVVAQPLPTPVAIFDSKFTNNSFRFSFATTNGFNYSAQFTPSFNPTNWSTLTNVAGNGSVVQVIDSTPTNTARYYRVSTQ